jgi:hypothetical protein
MSRTHKKRVETAWHRGKYGASLNHRSPMLRNPDTARAYSEGAFWGRLGISTPEELEDILNPNPPPKKHPQSQ